MLSTSKGIVDCLVCSNGSLVPLLLVIDREETFTVFVGEVLQLLVAVEEGRGSEEQGVCLDGCCGFFFELCLA